MTQYTYEPCDQTTLAGAAAPQSFQYTGRDNDVDQLPDGTTTVNNQAGTSQLGPLRARGFVISCEAKVTNLPLGGRKIRAICGASDGLLFGLAPPLGYDLTIVETARGGGYVPDPFGTVFPSLEVWQYGAKGGPYLIYFYGSSKYGTGPSDLFLGGQELPRE